MQRALLELLILVVVEVEAILIPQEMVVLADVLAAYLDLSHQVERLACLEQVVLEVIQMALVEQKEQDLVPVEAVEHGLVGLVMELLD
jgi:hypothetical protein